MASRGGRDTLPAHAEDARTVARPALRARMLSEEETARRTWARALSSRGLVGALGGALLQLAAFQGAPAAAPKARLMLERATAAIEASVRAARDVELALRPPLIEEAGLGPPLRWLAERAGAAGAVSVQLPATIPRLGIELEGLLFGAVASLLERGLRGTRTLTVRVTDATLAIELQGTRAREHAYAVAAARERLRGRARIVLRSRPRSAVVVRVSLGGRR